MQTNFLVVVIYFLVSMGLLIPLYLASLYFSGERFKKRWVFICLVLTVAIGTLHLGTAKYGYIILFPEIKYRGGGEDILGWIAFFFVFLHLFCLPTEYERKRWFSKDNFR